MMRKRHVALIAILGGVLVFSIKLLAYLVSDSVALLSDALESIVNVVASVMLFASIAIAERSEDAEHQYGHHKAENISALIEGLLIIVAALLIVETSVGRILDPVQLQNVDLGLGISLVATSVNALLSYVLMREARRSGSIALEGDSRHLLSDVLSSLGVVIGLALAMVTGWYVLDPLLALVMAVIIVRMGVSVLLKSSRDLMDQSNPEAERRIREELDAMDGYIEYHGVKTRRSGSRTYAELHLCVAGDMSVKSSHDLAEAIEGRLKERIPGLSLTIHVETEDQCASPRGLRAPPRN